ncbi:MAG TPA: hypothetical protein VGT03_14420 [Candidatus Acidoferrales bacterium]|nr:hypothetical protein [Candidatus Acidoferrales bacterium]
MAKLEPMSLSQDEFEELKKLQVKYRWDWPAVFSSSCNDEIWPFVRYGHTPSEQRLNVRGISPVIDGIADIYLKRKHIGGRFFVNEKGAFYKNHKRVEFQFVRFDIRK